jgi:hypothetical protein
MIQVTNSQGLLTCIRLQKPRDKDAAMSDSLREQLRASYRYNQMSNRQINNLKNMDETPKFIAASSWGA